MTSSYRVVDVLRVRSSDGYDHDASRRDFWTLIPDPDLNPFAIVNCDGPDRDYGG